LAQDQDIGRQSAAEAEGQLPILHDRSIDAYVGEIGERLVAVVPGANYPYQFKVVNASDIGGLIGKDDHSTLPLASTKRSDCWQ
jgi:predicted Zn-dependent protease